MRRPRRPAVGPLLVVALLAGCTMQKHREQVRQGFFTAGLHRGAFLEEWGIPSRTFAIPAPDCVLRPNAYGVLQRPYYEIWEYQAHATCLTFDGVRLLTWETDRTDCTPTLPLPDDSGPEPAPPYPPRR